MSNLQVTFKQITKGRELDVLQTFKQEYRLALRFMVRKKRERGEEWGERGEQRGELDVQQPSNIGGRKRDRRPKIYGGRQEEIA
jgi:hypothetical protein